MGPVDALGVFPECRRQSKLSSVMFCQWQRSVSKSQRPGVWRPGNWNNCLSFIDGLEKTKKGSFTVISFSQVLINWPWNDRFEQHSPQSSSSVPSKQSSLKSHWRVNGTHSPVPHWRVSALQVTFSKIQHERHQLRQKTKKEIIPARFA